MMCHSWAATWHLQPASAALGASLSSGGSSVRACLSVPDLLLSKDQSLEVLLNRLKNLTFPPPFLFFLFLSKGSYLQQGREIQDAQNRSSTLGSRAECIYPENRCRSPSSLPCGQGQASSELACWSTASIHGLLGLKGAQLLCRVGWVLSP